MANNFFGVGAFFLGWSGDAKQIFLKVSLTTLNNIETFPETRHLFIFLPKGKVREFWFQLGIYGRNEKSQGISEFSKKM